MNGPYAQDALNQIEIHNLLRATLTGNQAEYYAIESELNSWRRMADNLGIAKGEDRYRLRMLQEYIAITPPNVRCPCKRGICLRVPDDHWLECPVGEKEKKAVSDAEIEAAKRAHERDLQQRKEQHYRDLAASITSQWNTGVVKYLPQRIREALIADCSFNHL